MCIAMEGVVIFSVVMPSSGVVAGSGEINDATKAGKFLSFSSF
jgi:hypothetical protein